MFPHCGKYKWNTRNWNTKQSFSRFMRKWCLELDLNKFFRENLLRFFGPPHKSVNFIIYFNDCVTNTLNLQFCPLKIFFSFFFKLKPLWILEKFIDYQCSHFLHQFWSSCYQNQGFNQILILKTFGNIVFSISPRIVLFLKFKFMKVWIKLQFKSFIFSLSQKVIYLHGQMWPHWSPFWLKN